VVPPSERGTVTVGEGHVVVVVVVGTGPEGKPVSERPGEVVTGVSIDGLAESEGYPEVDGQDVEIISEKTVEERTRYSALSENEDFERVSVFSSETDRGREFVVKLVNVLVEGTPV